MWIRSQHIGSGVFTMKDAKATPAKQEGEESSKEEKEKAKVSEGSNPFFNPILNFFEVL